MDILWMGSMPGVRLFVGDRVEAWAAICEVEWSGLGSGRMLTLWHNGRSRVWSSNTDLARWMVGAFIGPMKRDNGVPWSAQAEFETAAVDLEIDLETGLHAGSGDVVVSMQGLMGRRLVVRERYPVEGTDYRVSFVYVPCEIASIQVGGTVLPGVPQIGRVDGLKVSTAQIAVAEVWAPLVGGGPSAGR